MSQCTCIFGVHTLFSPLDDRVIYLFFFVEGGVSIREMQSINKRNVIFILIWGGNYLKSQTIRTDPSNGENRVLIFKDFSHHDDLIRCLQLINFSNFFRIHVLLKRYFLFSKRTLIPTRGAYYFQEMFQTGYYLWQPTCNSNFQSKRKHKIYFNFSLYGLE